MADEVQTIVVALGVAIALLLGATIWGALGGVATPDADEDTDIRVTNDPVLLDGLSTIRIDKGEGTNETVRNSLGNAIVFSGTDDSYAEATGDVTVATDDNWTVAAWARVNSTSSAEDMTLVNAGGRVMIQYNGTTSDWELYYHSGVNGNTYRVTAAAPDQPSSYTHIAARANGTHLTLYRNGTARNSTQIQGDSVTAVRVNSTNWHGRLEEYRSYDDALTTQTVNALYTSPVAPVQDVNRTGRVMFDRAGANPQYFYFTGVALSTSNVTYADGHPGSVMDGAGIVNAITGSTDYRWDTRGPKIKPVDDGGLDGAPVAFVSYEPDPAMFNTLSGLASVVSFAAIIPIVLLAVLAIARLRGLS